MGFGTRFKTASRAQLRARATPPSGASPESIWHQAFDTQDFVSAATVDLSFFLETDTDRTITNMQAAGAFPEPQWLTIYDITLDMRGDVVSSVVGVDQGVGRGRDLGRILLVGRGTWLLNISDKNYGPYTLTTLHGTGGPIVYGWSGNTAATGNAQYAINTLSPGWNYYGSLIIPPKTNFNVALHWGAAQTLNATPVPLVLSLWGILSRRVL